MQTNYAKNLKIGKILQIIDTCAYAYANNDYYIVR